MFEFNLVGHLPKVSNIEDAFDELMHTNPDDRDTVIRLVNVIYRENNGESYKFVSFKDTEVRYEDEEFDCHMCRNSDLEPLEFIKF